MRENYSYTFKRNGHTLRCPMPVGLLPGHVLFLKVQTACVNCTYSVHREVLHFHYFIFLVAVPMLHWFTLVANLSEFRVSPKHSSLGGILVKLVTDVTGGHWKPKILSSWKNGIFGYLWHLLNASK